MPPHVQGVNFSDPDSIAALWDSDVDKKNQKTGRFARASDNDGGDIDDVASLFTEDTKKGGEEPLVKIRDRNMVNQWHHEPENEIWFDLERDSRLWNGKPAISETARHFMGTISKDLEFQLNDQDYVVVSNASRKVRRKGLVYPGVPNHGMLCVRMFGVTTKNNSLSVIIPCSHGNTAVWPEIKVEIPERWAKSEALQESFYKALCKTITNKVRWQQKQNKEKLRPHQRADHVYIRHNLDNGTLLKGYEVVQGRTFEPFDGDDLAHFMIIRACHPRIIRDCITRISHAFDFLDQTPEELKERRSSNWLPEELKGDCPTNKYSVKKKGLRCMDRIDFKYLFNVKREVYPGCIIRLHANKYELVPDVTLADAKPFRVTTTQLEAVCGPYDFTCVNNTDDIRKTPLLVGSFDIEVITPEDKSFPKPENDPICTSVYAVHNFDPNNDDPEVPIDIYRFQLGDAPTKCVQENLKEISYLRRCGIKGFVRRRIVHYFRTSAELLLAEREFRKQMQLDILTGYNTDFFDIWYQVKAAEALGINDQFMWLGKCHQYKSFLKDTVFESSARGKEISRFTRMVGLTQVDMFAYVRAQGMKLRSLKLGNVAKELLGGLTKDDLNIHLIGPYMKHYDKREAIMHYCERDAILPLLMMLKMQVLNRGVALSKSCGITFQESLTRGQQLKVYTALFHELREIHKDFKEDPDYRIFVPVDHMPQIEEYPGALVFPPRGGYYQSPVSVLDFKSLYPSVMMAYNMCPTTLNMAPASLGLRAETKIDCRDHDDDPGDYVKVYGAKLDPKDYSRYDPYHDPETMDSFVKPKIRKGVFPIMLEKFAKNRKFWKRWRDKWPKGSANYQAGEAAQLEEKLKMNACYGFNGTGTIGKYPCYQVARGVTTIGQRMLILAAHICMTKMTKSNGFKYDAEVVYGDTDSIMVHQPDVSVSQGMNDGFKLMHVINEQMRKPNEIELEKVFGRFNIIEGTKKKYQVVKNTPKVADGGTIVLDDDGNPITEMGKGVEVMGSENKRCDCCVMNAEVIDKFLHEMMYEMDKPKATKNLRQAVVDCYENRVPWNKLILSKKLSKSIEDYLATGKSPPVHVAVAQKMTERNPLNPPMPGQRIPYIMVPGLAKQKVCELGEDPFYAMSVGLEPDPEYYIQKQLRGIITRTFKYMLTKEEIWAIFSTKDGIAHRRKIKKVQSTNTSKMASTFYKRYARCVECRSPSSIIEGLCTKCARNMDIVSKLRIDTMEQMEQANRDRTTFYSTCRACIGDSLDFEDVHIQCTNTDCDVFWGWKKLDHTDSDAAQKSTILREVDQWINDGGLAKPEKRQRDAMFEKDDMQREIKKAKEKDSPPAPAPTPVKRKRVQEPVKKKAKQINMHKISDFFNRTPQ